MSVSVDRLRKLGRAGMIGVDLLVAVGLIAIAILIWRERTWVTPVTTRGPQEAFLHGSIGTEVMPLAVALVLPDLFPDNFQPAGTQNGDWVEQFGFLRDPDRNNKTGLPIGFVVTNYRPQSGAPSPAPFVGFACALCHSTQVRTSEDEPGRIIYGPGSVSLNLFAWLDAFQASILARERFVNWLETQGKAVGLTLPKGVSAQVKATACSLVVRMGPDALKRFAKVHFRTAAEVLDSLVEPAGPGEE